MYGLPESIGRLQAIGISYDDAVQLRRISMTLHRWHELECGDGNAYASWCIVRGHKPKREHYRDSESQQSMWRDVGKFEYDDNGKPYIERHVHTENKARYELIADRESGAKRRLARILKNYPALSAYIQGDPRGCALYIGENLTDSNYNRGVAVYK